MVDSSDQEFEPFEVDAQYENGSFGADGKFYFAGESGKKRRRGQTKMQALYGDDWEEEFEDDKDVFTGGKKNKKFKTDSAKSVSFVSTKDKSQSNF